MKRVALYGGSFDPPHHGHVMVATWALASGDFDEIRLLPVAGHAFGKALSPFETRCQMVDAAVRHLGPRVIVDPIEAGLPVPSYTVDTVRAMLEADPNQAITVVVGTDTWAGRARWREWDTLSTLVSFLVIGRDGYDAPADIAVPTTFPNISSTEARARIRRGEAVWSLLPDAVAEITAREHLYQLDSA
ncbi:MAG: nicotinate-nucleotide adenylyltransferase [Myxococcota bacterium]|jgi:nicotinate-nucleotide adenylyltransferase